MSKKILECESVGSEVARKVFGYLFDKPSNNTKTGGMFQFGVFVADEEPLAATKSGADEAVCNGCRMKPSKKEERKAEGIRHGCYVLLFRKLAQWRSLKDQEPIGVEKGTDIIEAHGTPVRFGEYGNMSNVPREQMEPLIQSAKGDHTLYENNWRAPHAQWLSDYAQASVQNLEEAREAWATGWKTFRQLRDGEEPVKGEEVMCPHETRGVQCIKCLLCNGSTVSITIPNHR